MNFGRAPKSSAMPTATDMKEKPDLIPNNPDSGTSPSALALREHIANVGRIYGQVGSRHHLQYPPGLSAIFPIAPDFDCGLRVLTRKQKVLAESRYRPAPQRPYTAAEKETGAVNTTILRTAELSVTDMLYSIGAQHYYATIRIHGGEFFYPDGCPADPDYPAAFRERPPGATVGSSGAWLEEEYAHRDVQDLTFEIERPLPQKDIDRHPDRYKHFKAGEPTHGFWSPDDALMEALKFFGHHFGPGWMLHGQYHYGGKNLDQRLRITMVTSVTPESGQTAPLVTMDPMSEDEY